MTNLALASPTDDDTPRNDHSDGPRAEFLNITPELALDLLTRNTHNRTLRTRVVAAYAADMRNGQWIENGDAIRTAIDGTLLDGQHRLEAILESETTQRMLIISNLANSAQETMDVGPKRTFSDVLKLRGETNCSLLAAACRRVVLWNGGHRRSHGNVQLTTAQLLATLEQHPDIRHSAQIADEVRKALPIHGSTLALCHWLFDRIDHDDCTFFFERLKDENAPGPRTQPIGILRRAVIQNMSAKSRLPEITMTAYVIKTWNAFREGRDLGLLRYKPGGAQPEVFPEPR